MYFAGQYSSVALPSMFIRSKSSHYFGCSTLSNICALQCIAKILNLRRKTLPAQDNYILIL